MMQSLPTHSALVTSGSLISLVLMKSNQSLYFWRNLQVSLVPTLNFKFVKRVFVIVHWRHSVYSTYLGADHATDVIKADCDFITATLENTPGSVLLPSQGTTAVTHQTCEFILFNLAGTAVQLSYWNWEVGHLSIYAPIFVLSRGRSHLNYIRMNVCILQRA
ncbi:hypothetical protein C8R44DRAFT_745578 [Mycena epipterygia]|nr:hypothetical protein C8R44DRAFT_745578 [Mycena epipterygia]